MLRRYLITNAVMTAVLVSVFKLVVSYEADFLNWARSSFETFAAQSSFVGPLIHRVILVGG